MSDPARVAAIDLGSNSAHLLIADVQSAGQDPAGRIRRVGTRKERLRLGEPVAREGAFGPDLRARVLDVIGDMTAHARKQGAERLALVATDALRHATDGQELERSLASEVGLPVRVLQGVEEAALSVRGMAGALRIPGPMLGLDLGGGSLEVALAREGRMVAGASLPFGAARATTRFEHDPPWLAERASLHEEALTALRTVADQLRAEHGDDVLPAAAGTAGTIRDLGRVGLAVAAGVEVRHVRGLVATREQLESAVARLVAVPTGERLDMAGVSASRADLLPAGGLVLLAVMEALGLQQLTLCDWGLREGVVLDSITDGAYVRHDDFVAL